LAAPDAQEAFLLSEETAQPIWGAGASAALAWLAAVRGQHDDAEEFVLAAERVALPARSRAVCSLTTLTRGMLAQARGESEVAYQHLRRMLDPTDLAHHHMTSAWGIASLADAAIAIGSAPVADELIADLAARGERRGSAVHRRMLAHASAVLASNSDAGGLFVAALEQVREPAFDRAQLQLAHGIWLRRHRRIVEARDALRAARETFDAIGAVPWGERAREELRASGEGSTMRRPGALDDLSPQELQMAQLAGAGLTNREIGERLFLSHRTVASHLYRVFPKLNVTSRAQLRDALAAGQS
jgi:ATP/maltotriose-dependent transcriptional regulator MalT